MRPEIMGGGCREMRRPRGCSCQWRRARWRGEESKRGGEEVGGEVGRGRAYGGGQSVGQWEGETGEVGEKVVGGGR
jgi:hypothetical protein